MKSKFNKYGLSIVLVLALVLALSGVFACDNNFNGNICHLGSETLTISPNVLIAEGNSQVFNLSQTFYHIYQVKISWKDSHSGCVGRLEFPHLNTTWNDVATSETQSFKFGIFSRVNSDDITIAINKENANAHCSGAIISEIVVTGLVGNCFNNHNHTNNNTTPGNDTNNTSATIPLVFIFNPMNNSVYNFSEIQLDVDSDQTINNWIYNLDNSGNVSFNPGVNLTLLNGTHTIRVYGTNLNGTGFASSVFNIILGSNSTLPGNETNNTNSTNVTNSIFNITNITTNPNLPVINNGTSQNISVNFSSNEYPLNILFKLFNSAMDNVDQQAYNNISASSLPLTYIIPSNLSNGVYYIYMNVTNVLGNSSQYLVGNFTVNRTINNGSNGGGNDDDNDDDDNHDTNDNIKNKDVIKLDSPNQLLESNRVISLSGLSSKQASGLKVFFYWGIFLILLLLIAIVSLLIFRKFRK